MKCKELIEQLQQFDPELVIEIDSCGEYASEEIEQIKVEDKVIVLRSYSALPVQRTGDIT
jgi:hypothetical protein